MELVQIHCHSLNPVLIFPSLSCCYLPRGLLLSGLITYIPTHYLSISRSYECYMPLPSHSFFDCPNNIHTLFLMFFGVFSTVHHSIQLFHQPTLMHNFLYSLTICMLYYYPRHVSSINMPIFRRKNCIHTASGIVAAEQSALNRCTVQPFTESDDVNTIFLLKMGILMLETCRE